MCELRIGCQLAGLRDQVWSRLIKTRYRSTASETPVPIGRLPRRGLPLESAGSFQPACITCCCGLLKRRPKGSVFPSPPTGCEARREGGRAFLGVVEPGVVEEVFPPKTPDPFPGS